MNGSGHGYSVYALPEAVIVGYMKDNELCNGASDCVMTSLAFIAVIIAWIILLCWMVC
jgi:hypothetical protein